MTNKSLQFQQNGSFEFWTSCPKINCNPLPSLNPVLLPQNTRSILLSPSVTSPLTAGSKFNRARTPKDQLGIGLYRLR